MNRRVAALLALFGVFVSACGGGDGSPDAATARDAFALADASGAMDGTPSLSFVEFAITGCDDSVAVPGTEDAGVPDAGAAEPCRGSAPLALSFNAVAPATIVDYSWGFGDGTGSNEANPTYVYRTPGVYDISLAVSGPTGGIAAQTKPGFVIVLPGRLGDACSDDGQCGDLECICDLPECPPGAAMCSASCATEPCAAGVCADLAAGGPTAPQDWQRALCLAECDVTSDCPGGLTCQELIAPDGAWVKACFAPGLLGTIGDSCTDADGALDGATCASGDCAPLGARGVCAAACGSNDDCPASSACATFAGGGPSLCLARCEQPDACASDPWLACEQPGGTGAFDFDVDEPAAKDGYCAPKRCAAQPECGIDGQCVAGFCAP